MLRRPYLMPSWLDRVCVKSSQPFASSPLFTLVLSSQGYTDFFFLPPTASRLLRAHTHFLLTLLVDCRLDDLPPAPEASLVLFNSSTGIKEPPLLFYNLDTFIFILFSIMSQDPPAAPPLAGAAPTPAALHPEAQQQYHGPLAAQGQGHEPSHEQQPVLNEKAAHAPASPNSSPDRLRPNSLSEKPSRPTSSMGEDPDAIPSNLAASSTDTSTTLADEKAAPKKKGLFKRKPKAERDKDLGELVKPVSIPTMFRYAKRWEMAANFFGIFLACAAGATQPLMTLIFGRLTTSFTQFGMIVNQIATQGPTPENTARLERAREELKHDSGMNALYLMAIGIGMVRLSERNGD